MIRFMNHFRRIWLIFANRLFCYPDHSFSTEIGVVFYNETHAKEDTSFGSVIYTWPYF
jgi:hypothetical protein